MSDRILQVSRLTAGYRDGLDILTDVQLDVAPQEVVTVVGANGAGKSTLLKAVMGWVPYRQGVIRFVDHDLIQLQAFQTARLGMGYVPQLNNVFPSLTVDENLGLGATRARAARVKQRKAYVYELFPQLRAASGKPAGVLSGGQRQMLAMGRALMPEPRMIMLDEPTAGLAPQYVDHLFQQVLDIRDAGVTVLMVEQNARRALEISDRGYVLDLGRNRYTGTGAELLNDPRVVAAYLGDHRDEAGVPQGDQS